MNDLTELNPSDTNAVLRSGAGWEPPSAPLDMPRQVLEREVRSLDWLAVLRRPWTRSGV
ncbi:hypothetical protein M4578_24515 [Salipiger sp. P9]|uniref:hypothetical protein n=1 Tax=Salipiger pentaromativorans TaxID=2943193 RepID=UPI0021570BF0|nr:hypothetical protein [Salipiger pentaromativorans]MCR8550996.1 hypothetical protein [Salipiger pentaromativorans]